MAARDNTSGTDKLSGSQDGDKEAIQTAVDPTGGVASDDKMDQE
jgi:hypothetical protein